jgi:hypothetical protein
VGEVRNAFKNLVLKPEGKRPLVRLKHRWEFNNRRMYLKDLGREAVHCTHPAQDRDQW